MASKKKQKIRTSFRKNRGARSRERDLTRRFRQNEFQDDDQDRTERVTGKGELTRKRTVVGTVQEDTDAGLSVRLEVDDDACLEGRVLSVHGLVSTVQARDGSLYRCAVRRLLKTLTTDQRHVLAAGDLVKFRPAGDAEGIIECIEPRRGVLCRTSRARQHVLVANVDQLILVASAAQPQIKPNLIDRLLITAEKSGIDPVICINKMDLIHPADLQPLVGVYGQLGYRVLLVSAKTGQGIDRLRRCVAHEQSVVIGQSGVGKSSLLNAIEAGLDLPIQAVSEDTEKGKHTTTTASLIPLRMGGYIVDTPGIRQFQLWDVIAEEVAGFFVEFRPYINHCQFPNCTHTHEDECAVKNAVADCRLDVRRYESYCQIVTTDTT